MKLFFKNVFIPLKKMLYLINSSLKYKFIAYFLMLSVIPIIILGSAAYIVTGNIIEDRATKSSLNMIVNKINSFDLSCNNLIETIISDVTSSMDTLVWLKSVNESLDSGSSDFSNYDTLTKIGAKFDSTVNQKGDIIKSIAIFPKTRGLPLIRGLTEIDFSEVYRKGGAYELTLENAHKTLWMHVNNIDSGKTDYIQITRAINDEYREENEGILAIYIDMGYLNDIFEDPGLEKGNSNFLINDYNEILFNSDISYLPINSNTYALKYKNQEIIDKVRSGTSGSFTFVIDGKLKIITYATSKVTGWKLVSVLPVENIRKDVAGVSGLTIIISIFCAIYAILVAVYVYKSIYSPIKKLTKAIRKFGEGDLDIRVASKRTDELGKLSDNFNDMTTRMKKLIDSIEVQEKRKKETEIRFLQAQITPHFLYNTLNSIKSLARLGRGEDISNMVVALISLLRVSVSNTKEFITIEEELNYVKSYIKIMEYRYDKKINISYHLAEDIKDCGILKFIVQPIVENCIIHAFNETLSDCTIAITVYKKENDVILEISDNGVGTDKDSINQALYGDKESHLIKFNGIGIYNINERLKLNFGDKYGLVYNSIIGNGTTVQMRMPYFLL